MANQGDHRPDHVPDATKMVRLAPLPSFTFGSHTHALNFIAASLTDLGGEQEALAAVCAHIAALTRRLAEVEVERDDMREAMAVQAKNVETYASRAEAAEAQRDAALVTIAQRQKELSK